MRPVQRYGIDTHLAVGSNERVVPTGMTNELISFGGTVCLCSNMASSGTDFRCTKCDRKICDESYPFTLSNRHMYVSG